MNKILLGMLVLMSVLVFGCSSQVQNIEASTSVNTASGAVTGLSLGNLAPDFELVTVDGDEVTLSGLTADGKPTLVYFFATWCPFCAQDFTTLSKVYEEYEDDVAIVVSSLDTKESASLIKSYRTKYVGLEEVMFTPGSEKVLRNYNVRYTTTKYAVGRDGLIKYAGSGPLAEDQWRTLLDMLKNS